MEKVNPISDSDSRTNVAYSVVVKFKGDTAAVPANESVTVIFGMDEEAIQNAISMTEGGLPRNPESGNMEIGNGGRAK